MKKIFMMIAVVALACGVMGCGTNMGNTNSNDGSQNATYKNETKWGKITSVNADGFTMDVGVLDDSNVFSVNDDTADVKLHDDTDIRMSAFNDAMNNTDDRDMMDATVDNLKIGDLVAVEFDDRGHADTVIIKMPTNE